MFTFIHATLALARPLWFIFTRTFPVASHKFATFCCALLLAPWHRTAPSQLPFTFGRETVLRSGQSFHFIGKSSEVAHPFGGAKVLLKESVCEVGAGWLRAPPRRFVRMEKPRGGGPAPHHASGSGPPPRWGPCHGGVLLPKTRVTFVCSRKSKAADFWVIKGN